MRPYELTVIFPTEEDLYGTQKEAVTAILTKNGAEIVKEEEVGDRQLAYEIKGRSRGRYVLYQINLDPANVIAIDKVFKLEKNILKFLFICPES